MAVLLERQYGDGSGATFSGAREDLSDLISNVDAKSTVFTSMARKGKKPGNAVMGWQMDFYESATADTAVVDGTDVDMTSSGDGARENPAANRVLMQNYVQIFRRHFRISSLANEIQIVAGIKSELANGIAKKLVELKRDMELTFLNDYDARADNGTDSYRTKAMGSFLHLTGGSSPFSIPGDEFLCTARTAAIADEVTESIVQTLLGTLFDTTGTIRDYDLVLGSALKRTFTSFTQSATGTDVSGRERLAIKTFGQAASERSFINVIDVFEGDFGRLRLHPSTFIAEEGSAVTFKGYAIPFDKVEIRYGKLPQIKELTDNGGGPARLLEAVAALVVDNPAGFGYFDCISAS